MGMSLNAVWAQHFHYHFPFPFPHTHSEILVLSMKTDPLNLFECLSKILFLWKTGVIPYV